MIEIKSPAVEQWFECWNSGNIEDLPIADDFTHTSPFGTIEGKKRYLEIVAKNKQDFLGNTLIVTKQITEGTHVCVQFEQSNKNTGLEMTVCEWYELEGDVIKSIRSFYNIGNAEITG
ncbi:nuclear transport factor 2 family protein [Pseudoteredinibacter isoporae]|uniref:Limonene-1,2-epoxide hydrolase n=1 Tax=Pseudoteredinibacter isoporae TaxID=570281 RepID=A0A7X0JSG4_9GAMM|nr:nuclear transport factor 2 family protein [Pseudoteredinibacter isoporae]MBB6521458.1 limonene-1,2-epoxide hydrolase [Pseudoteredinibacter isoporae]NHO87012.1 nuclear transport factor 2 family protein [Pseudoteredinibacter isoporae]NIB24535.1 nuclear transport factor 2 family protein [Pseudoteredinibacter isoporae]